MLRISELRQIKGITQKELAEKLNVKNYTVGNWEQGRAEPSIEDIINLADFFECSVDYLLGREDELGNVSIAAQIDSNESRFFNIFSRLPQNKQDLVVEVMLDMLEAARSRGEK